MDNQEFFHYSVIVPFRDKYDLFVKAVKSIPDREDIQVIIVDNAPKQLLLDQVPKKERGRIDLVKSSPSKGAGCARNEGIKHVLGQYLLFLDADDYYTSNAFDIFDKYLVEKYDIVFFNPTSIYLKDGSASNRHQLYTNYINRWLVSHDESKLRYRWFVPWAKLFRSEFVIKGGFEFAELPVQNDAWFSLVTGHAAKSVFCDDSIVYVVTEGESGQSLVKIVNRESSFIRYCERIRINKHLKTIGHYDMRIRLLGSLKIAFKEFGFKEFLRYLNVARKNKVGIF